MKCIFVNSALKIQNTLLQIAFSAILPIRIKQILKDVNFEAQNNFFLKVNNILINQ